MNDSRHTRHNRRRVVLMVMALAIAIGGCTSPAKFRPATGEKFPPYEGEVRLLENLPAPGQYRRIGVVVVEGVQLTQEAAMVDVAKRSAAANGADAIIKQAPVKLTKDGAGSVKKTLAVWAIRLNR